MFPTEYFQKEELKDCNIIPIKNYNVLLCQGGKMALQNLVTNKMTMQKLPMYVIYQL